MKQIDKILIGTGIIAGSIIVWFIVKKPLRQDNPYAVFDYNPYPSAYPGEAFNESDFKGFTPEVNNFHV